MSELTETDVQVLSWLYEYTVKHRHKELSAYIEAKCKARGIQPEFQFAKGFVVFVRHIQILTSKDLRKREHQKALIQLFEDLMRLRQFQALHRFYKKLIKLYVTTKLLVLNKQELNHDNILKQIPYFNWQQLQQDFGLMDDHFKTHFEVAIHSAHAAVQKCASKHKRILLLDRSLLHKSETYVQDSIPKLVSSLCEVFPCTALEKLVADEDLCKGLIHQGIKAYKVLIENMKSGVTENSIRKVIKLLMQKKIEMAVGIASQSNSEENSISNVDSHTAENCIYKENVIIQVNNKLWHIKPANLQPLRPQSGNENVKNSITSTSSVFPDNLCSLVKNSGQLKKKIPVKTPCDIGNEIIVINSKIREIKKEKLVPIRISGYTDTSISEFLGLANPCGKSSIDSLEEKDLESLISELESLLLLLKEKCNQKKRQRYYVVNKQRNDKEDSAVTTESSCTTRQSIATSPIQSSALEKNIGHHSCSSVLHKTSELEQTEQNTDMAVCGSELEQTEQNTDMAVCGSELEQTEQNTDMAVCGSNMTASCSTSILAVTAVEGFSSIEGNAAYSIGMQEHSGVSNVDESGDFKFDTALTQCGEKADMVDEYSEEDMTFHTAQESCNNTLLRDFDRRKVSDQNKRKEEDDSLDSNIHQKKKIKVK